MSHSDNLKFKIWSDSLYRVQNICPKQAECLMLVYISKRDSLRESLPADFFWTPNHSCLQLFQQPPPPQSSSFNHNFSGFGKMLIFHLILPLFSISLQNNGKEIFCLKLDRSNKRNSLDQLILCFICRHQSCDPTMALFNVSDSHLFQYTLNGMKTCFSDENWRHYKPLSGFSSPLNIHLIHVLYRKQGIWRNILKSKQVW